MPRAPRVLALCGALGPRGRDVSRLILQQGVPFAVIGVGLGVAVALLAGPLLATLLYGVSPRDPLVLALVCTALLAVSILACIVPARRASRVDPMVALRSE